jgi:hypothetical protein
MSKGIIKPNKKESIGYLNEIVKNDFNVSDFDIVKIKWSIIFIDKTISDLLSDVNADLINLENKTFEDVISYKEKQGFKYRELLFMKNILQSEI